MHPAATAARNASVCTPLRSGVASLRERYAPAWGLLASGSSRLNLPSVCPQWLRGLCPPLVRGQGWTLQRCLSSRAMGPAVEAPGQGPREARMLARAWAPLQQQREGERSGNGSSHEAATRQHRAARVEPPHEGAQRGPWALLRLLQRCRLARLRGRGLALLRGQVYRLQVFSTPSRLPVPPLHAAEFPYPRAACLRSRARRLCTHSLTATGTRGFSLWAGSGVRRLWFNGSRGRFSVGRGSVSRS